MLSSRVAVLHDNSTHGEDHYLTRTVGSHVFLDAVMDGVSRRGGGQASRLLMEALAIAPLSSAEDVVAVLEAVNQQLYQRGGGRFFLTTVSAVLCLDDRFFGLSAGDSPGFLIRSAACQQLSSPVPGIFVGASTQLVKLHRVEDILKPGDRLVLTSDGVMANISRRELVEIVWRAASPDEAVAALDAVMTARRLGEWLPEELGGRFRHDDRTAIIRFFS